MPQSEQSKERARQRAREWRKANPEKALAQGRTYWRKYHLKKAYGITEFQFDYMMIMQKNRCAGCERPPVKRALNVDHDHVTGKIRGLLCDDCNLSLGRVQDNPTTLRRLAQYLER